MTEHDFKEVLNRLSFLEVDPYKAFTKGEVKEIEEACAIWLVHYHDTVKFALKLAEYVQSGVVTAGMLQAAHDTPIGAFDDIYRKEYKAMTQKLMEEIGDDV
jgi:hypothetical protein